jgi:RNA binding exosome subunit
MTVITTNAVTDIEEVLEAIASMNSTDLHCWISHRQGSNTETNNLLELLKTHIENSWELSERMEKLFTAAKEEKILQHRKERGIRHADLLKYYLRSRHSLETEKELLGEQAIYLLAWMELFKQEIIDNLHRLWDNSEKERIQLSALSISMKRTFKQAMEKLPSDGAKVLWLEMLEVLRLICGRNSPFTGLQTLHEWCQCEYGEYLMR